MPRPRAKAGRPIRIVSAPDATARAIVTIPLSNPGTGARFPDTEKCG